MDKQIITFTANEQCLRKTGGLEVFATKTVSYIEAHFDLGTNWSGYDSVRAVWWNDYVRPISTVLDSDGVCIVPTEVLLRKGTVYVNLVGSIAEGDVLTDRLTTIPITALVEKFNAHVDSTETAPITPSQFEQFVEAVKADADRAEDAKDDARGYASDAQTYAENASASASNASTSEDNAKVSELNAEAYKNQAQTYAQNAYNSSVSAENAKDDAILARDEIRNMSAEATTLPAGSDATASYSDGVLSLGIPKGDTGAKGDKGDKGDTGATPNISIGTVETLDPTDDATATITGTAENPVLNLGIPQGVTGEVSYADLSTLLPTDTASGAIASFPDGQSVIPALSVVTDIEPIQDLHGYDKPWSGGAGKNKVDISTVSVPANVDTTLVLEEVALKAGTYTLSYTLNKTITATRNRPLYSIGSASTYSNDIKTAGRGLWTFTLTEDSTITLKWWYHTVSEACTISDFQLEQGSTATAYAPYSNVCPISGHTEVVTSVSPTTDAEDVTSYTTSLGRTVYGGTLDVVSGVLTVTHELRTFDGSSSESWNDYTSGLGGYYIYVANHKTESCGDGWCNVFPTSRSANTEGVIYGINSKYIFFIGSHSIAETVADWRTWLASNPLQVVYELATPQTYQLTPQEVQTLLGDNNIWASTGTVEVTYKADVTKWVEKHLS